MSSLTSLVAVGGVIKQGDPDGPDVTMVQLALFQAGYRVAADGLFGPRTVQAVKSFQAQHGLKADGIVGVLTAAMLDAPHKTLVETAKPLVTAGWPHDDTASLISFYGDPTKDHERWKQANVTRVPCPWTLYYDGQPWHHPIQIHQKCSAALHDALQAIWKAADGDENSKLLFHVKHFSGSGNLRTVRGSSRLSTHAFWAAVDFDAVNLPLGKKIGAEEMPKEIVEAFDAVGWYWGGRFTGRPDAQHFQAAHE